LGAFENFTYVIW